MPLSSDVGCGLGTSSEEGIVIQSPGWYTILLLCAYLGCLFIEPFLSFAIVQPELQEALCSVSRALK